MYIMFFFFSSRRRHTRYWRDWSSDVCSSDLQEQSNRRETMNSKHVVRRGVLAIAFAGLLAGGAYAQSQDPTPQQQDIQNDKKDIRSDKKDLAKDRADRNADCFCRFARRWYVCPEPGSDSPAAGHPER